MQKQQRPQTRVEGNIIYIIRELRNGGAENVPAPKLIVPKADSQNTALNPVLFKVEETNFATEARLADKNGNEMLKERLCAEGISHYARALRELNGTENYASSKENLVRSSAILRNIADLYGIWGYEEARKSYLRLSRSLVELAIEIK
jgi:hypothetical protein